MWQQLIGTPGYAAGSSGTVTVPAGAVVILIMAHASAGGAGFTLFGGASQPVVNGAPPLIIPFFHTLWQANGANGGTIVFTGTDSYRVEWVKQGNV